MAEQSQPLTALLLKSQTQFSGEEYVVWLSITSFWEMTLRRWMFGSLPFGAAKRPHFRGHEYPRRKNGLREP
jgi:hypothetical protein